jgi:hypothetical protein
MIFAWQPSGKSHQGLSLISDNIFWHQPGAQFRQMKLLCGSAQHRGPLQTAWVNICATHFGRWGAKKKRKNGFAQIF